MPVSFSLPGSRYVSLTTTLSDEQQMISIRVDNKVFMTSDYVPVSYGDSSMSPSFTGRGNQYLKRSFPVHPDLVSVSGAAFTQSAIIWPHVGMILAGPTN